LVSHWLQFETDEPFVPNLKKFGFVYLIINTQNGKGYVGCKQYFAMNKKKTKHKWETYTGSSKYLNADIKKIGKENFRFEVISEYKNKRSLRYYEMYYQIKWDVLTSVIEGTDEPAFYNSYVGGKFFPPIEMYKDPERCKRISKTMKKYFSSEEARQKASDASNSEKIPIKCTKENGDIIILKGKREIKKAGYDASTLYKLAKGGYQKRSDRPNGKGYSIRTKHKDIIKAEYIERKEETNGN